MTQPPKRKLLYNFLETVPNLILDKSKNKKVKGLNQKILMELFEEKLCAIHVPNYCDGKLAEKAGKKILGMVKIKNYSLPVQSGNVKTDVDYGLGFPKRLALSSKKLTEKYYREAVNSIRKVRLAFSPTLSPIDRLRLELDEIWPAGASIGHSEGKTELAGTIRHMYPTPHGLIHIDDFNRTTRRVFSACFYMKVPKLGGELEIWNVSLGNENRRNPLFQVCNTFDLGTQAVLRKRYPKPLKVKVQAGDLALFDTGRPHAVAGFRAGYRLALQVFVVYEGIDKPLKLFS